MGKRNLPIKVILPRTSDNVPNKAGGKLKYFGEVTGELQNSIIDQFEEVFNYYEEVFIESENVPVVGKIYVKEEAIAKSYKPNDLCRNCPIIGTGQLDELYVKLTSRNIHETIEIIKTLPSQRVKANLTALREVSPFVPEDKISKQLIAVTENNKFSEVKEKIKIKIFDFDNEYDNEIIHNYVKNKIQEMELDSDIKYIKYGEKIEYIKIRVESVEDINKLAKVNGIKTIDFFQEYSMPINSQNGTDFGRVEEREFQQSDEIIGIIDGGISPSNKYLNPYIVARETYVPSEYQNHSHGTFIASTIQYGDYLNGISGNNKSFNFLDVVAIPNSDPKIGPVDSIGEIQLMEIIEDVMGKYSKKVKIWNISLGMQSIVSDGKTMSDLGVFLDYIQHEYDVQFIVSSGNIEKPPLRTWPPQENYGEHDRIISPADSVRAITVGSLAYRDSDISIVNKDEPSPFSRRGPGVNFIVKPDLVDYGGNIDCKYCVNGLGMIGMDIHGNAVEGIGTSYSAPRVARKVACIHDELVEKNKLLAKALTIHSARLKSRELINSDNDLVKYYGFGMPSIDSNECLKCNSSEVTMIFKQKLVHGTHLEMYSFPYPKSLIKNGKYIGEICMTLAYDPLLDERYGQEYCRANIDASFGTYNLTEKGIDFHGQVPVEKTWDGNFEKAKVENGFKWSPIKSYYRKLPRGINVSDGWKLRLDMYARNGTFIEEMEFVLIVTIKDPNNNDIYSEIINGLRENGYITNNLELRHQIRPRI
jgi:hypothetical protein